MADKAAGLTVLYARIMAVYHRELSPRAHRRRAVSRGGNVQDPGLLLVEPANGALFDPPVGPAFYPRAVAANRRPCRTRNGYVAALIYNDKGWAAFVEAVEQPGWR